jgi:drug/metabolite transporter (DMT)-like permease
MKGRLSYFFLLHFIVFIFGFTGILGKAISLDSFDLVVYRMLIAALSLLVFIKVTQRSLRMERRWVIKLILTGGIAGCHWITFFHAIKISNVSVTLACISSSALFTALLEPIFFRKKLDYTELLMGSAIIVGIALITNAEFEYRDGILLSLLSAFLGSLFGVLNGVFIRNKRPAVISFYELSGGLVLVLIGLLVAGHDLVLPHEITAEDWLYLLILGTVATAYAFVVSIFVMRELSPFTVALAINLEPVYAIIMAWALFHEKMNDGFYSGVSIILVTLFANGYIKRYRARNRKPVIHHELTEQEK